MFDALIIATEIVVGFVLIALLVVVLIAGIYELALGHWDDPMR